MRKNSYGKLIFKYFESSTDAGFVICKSCRLKLKSNRMFNLKVHLLKKHKINIQIDDRTHSSTSSKSVARSKKKTKKQSNEDTNFSTPVSSANSAWKPEMSEMATSRPPNEYEPVTDESDIYDHMGKMWASKMRRLPKPQRLFAERAIGEILFEAAMGTLHQSSVQINQTIASSTNNQHSAQVNETTVSRVGADSPIISICKEELQPNNLTGSDPLYETAGVGYESD